MQQLTSVVKWFDAKKGYGFLVNPDGGADIFVHYTSIVSDSRFRTLRPDEEVTFEIEEGQKGLHARTVVSQNPLPDEDVVRPRFQAPDASREAQPGLVVPASADLPFDVPPLTTGTA